MSLRVLGRTGSINERKALGALDALGLDYGQEDRGLPPHARRGSRNRWTDGSPILEAYLRDRDLVVGDTFSIADVTPGRHTLDER